jgi:hypothetical protein
VLKEQSSMRSAPTQVDAFWKAGESVDRSVFSDRQGPEIGADQMPLIRAGIPSLLIVDSEYPHLDETLGKCAPRSLETIGQAVMNYITLPEKPAQR